MNLIQSARSLLFGVPKQRQNGAVKASAGPWDLDTPLLQFSSNPADVWRIRDACEGLQCFGGIGSGKSSGSGATVAKAFLRHGFGGLVLCAPPGEKDAWLEMAEATGRSADVVVFSPEEPHAFNFLDYEMRRGGRGGGQTENLVNLFSVVMEIVEGKTGSAAGDDFFVRATKELLRAGIDALRLAQGSISIGDIKRLVDTAPTSTKQMQEKGQGSWRSTSYCFKTLAKARANAGTPRDQHDYGLCENYFLRTFPQLADRTRTSVTATLNGVIDVLLHGDCYQLLGTGLTIIPEVTYKNGAIVLVDLPIQEYGEVGRIVQGIWKYMFQRALLRRNAKEWPRPVFLYCDESQNFISSFDFKYQAECRKAKAATVYLTQNIDNYYAVLGGKTETDALLSNFVTKCFHSNSGNTNQWASDLISIEREVIIDGSVPNGGEGGSLSFSEKDRAKVLPSAFMTLKKGGPINDLIVEGIIVQSGRLWNDTGETYILVQFLQGA